MRKHEKIYWRIKNFYQRISAPKDATGLLDDREDSSDFQFGGSISEYTQFIDPKKWIFSQNPFNICVFASSVMGSSVQEGKRFSVKFAVKLARKKGLLKGNGWSYIRAGLEIATKYGRLPYEMMPDEIHGQSWDEYSGWDITEEMLKEASKWKAPNYQRVRNTREAREALAQGYALYTGLNWTSEMNMPLPPKYLLTFGGYNIGGHAITILKDPYTNPNTFGKRFADEGCDYLTHLFGKGIFSVYLLEKLPNRTDTERIMGMYDGEKVKADKTYIITPYGKKEVAGEPSKNLPANVIHNIPNI